MYTFESRVRYSETDEKGILSIAGIVDYFQDVSTFQSEDLGLGISYLKERNLLWVMSAWQIVVHARPALGDKITVGTFPYDFKGFMGLRNFFMDDETGRRLVEANSIWTLMNTEKGAPARLTEEMRAGYVLSERLPMTYAPRKIQLPSDGAEGRPFQVARQHLDGNHHVNNGQYIHMAMDYLPDDFAVGQMRVEYKKQALLNDTIIPVMFEKDGVRAVSLEGLDRQPYAVIEFSGPGCAEAAAVMED